MMRHTHAIDLIACEKVRDCNLVSADARLDWCAICAEAIYIDAATRRAYPHTPALCRACFRAQLETSWTGGGVR